MDPSPSDFETACILRLERAISATANAFHPNYFKALRAYLHPSANLAIATLEIECVPNHGNSNPASSDHRQQDWHRVSREMQSDCEMTFFSATFSRPALKRRGLFHIHRTKIATREIDLSLPSAHRCIQAHNDLKNLQKSGNN